VGVITTRTGLCVYRPCLLLDDSCTVGMCSSVTCVFVELWTPSDVSWSSNRRCRTCVVRTGGTACLPEWCHPELWLLEGSPFLLFISMGSGYLWTAVAYGPSVIWVWRATVEWYWQGKTEELEEKPDPMPLCPPQVQHGLTLKRASAARDRRLIATAEHRCALVCKAEEETRLRKQLPACLEPTVAGRNISLIVRFKY
jgi:hypothetical protein